MSLAGADSLALLRKAQKLIPPLLHSFHKGQAGRIAVLGGCEDYTGAPYFSAIASTLVGADMSHVICERNAGQVIKTYSPDLMVHPYLFDSRSKRSDETDNDALTKVKSLLDRIHVLVVGPGLGRDPVLLDLVSTIIKEARGRQMPIVIDADGLYLVQNNLKLITGGGKSIILTPNVVEFQRLAKAAGGENSEISNASELAGKLSVTILRKGQNDQISNGKITIENDTDGGLKRVSGQGDTLSGSLATFLAWRQFYHQKLWDHDSEINEDDSVLLAAFAASSLTRTASRLAYKDKGRATLTSDISKHIGVAYKELFE